MNEIDSTNSVPDGCWHVCWKRKENEILEFSDISLFPNNLEHSVCFSKSENFWQLSMAKFLKKKLNSMNIHDQEDSISLFLMNNFPAMFQQFSAMLSLLKQLTKLVTNFHLYISFDVTKFYKAASRSPQYKNECFATTNASWIHENTLVLNQISRLERFLLAWHFSGTRARQSRPRTQASIHTLVRGIRYTWSRRLAIIGIKKGLVTI